MASHARASVDEWVAAGLLLQRGAAPTIELLTLTRPWIEATVEVLALLPPLGVVADLGRLLARAPFDIAASSTLADPGLREAVDAYEEHLLGRLAADTRLEAARDALLRLDESLRPAAIAVFVEQVLARLTDAASHGAHRPGELDELDSPGPAAVRRVIHRHGLDLVELGAQVLDPLELDPEQRCAGLRTELSRSYAGLARAARQCGALIGDTELYTLENHAALRSPSQRLAMAQIAEAAQLLERALPARVRRSEASRGRTPTKIEDESSYPIGGYSSISTIGGIESLVSSELIYMGSAAEREAGEIDLFDVRWAGGELLKYTRDESVHTRERRTISFALAPSLVGARVKDPGLPFQRLVVGFGGIVAGVRKLVAWLDEAELHLHLLLLASPGERQRPAEQPLREEAKLAALLLREYVEAGVVEIIEVSSPLDREGQPAPALDHAGRDTGVLAATRARAEAAAATGGSDLVWLIGEPDRPALPAPLQPRNPRVREHALSLDGAQPRLWIDAGRGTEERSVRGDGWEAWIRAFAELHQALV
jgi:hypothetical protein